MSKILLALHDVKGHDSFKLLVKLAGSQAIIPQTVSLDSVIDALSQNPDKVLLDVNYGVPNSDNLEPFLRVEKEMTARGYDTKTALIGVSGRDYLIESARQQYPDFNFFIKGTDSGRVLNDFFE